MSILGAKLWFIGAFNSRVYTELHITFLLQTYLLIDGFLSVKGPNTVELCQALIASDTISIWILALLFTDCNKDFLSLGNPGARTTFCVKSDAL